MGISNHTASQLAKVINKNDNNSKPVVNYGTIVESGGQKYVKIDGSTYNTPFISLTDTRADERVTVEVVNHQVIVKGNMTNPAIGKNTVGEIVDRIDGDMDDMETDYNNKIDQTNLDLEQLRKDAEAERKRIEKELTEQIDLAKQAAKEADDHAEAAEKVATDYIEAKPGDGFYVGTSDTSEYHVHINAAGIKIRKGYTSPLVLSSWNASELVIGQTTNFHSSMKVNQFRLRGPSSGGGSIIDYMTIGLNGMSLKDASGKEYSNYGTTSFRIGYTDANKVNLYGTNTALQFRLGTTMFSEYAMNRIQIGPMSGVNKNIVIDQNGIILGQGASTNTNYKLASFTASEITLGDNSTSSVIKLCKSKGSLSYGEFDVGTILDEGPTKNTGIKLESTDDVILSSGNGKDISILAKYGSELGGLEAFTTNNGHIWTVVGTKRPSGENSYIFMGYNPDIRYSCDHIYAFSKSVELNGSRWVWIRGNGIDTSASPGFSLYGFKFIDFYGNFRQINNIDESRMRIFTSHIHSQPNYTQYVWFNAESEFWVSSPDVKFVDCSRFYVSSPYVEFTNCSHFWCNNTDWITSTATASASLYETQIQQSKAIVSLYENQMAQNEAIIALYESTL